MVLTEGDDFLGTFFQGPESINLGLQVLHRAAVDADAGRTLPQRTGDAVAARKSAGPRSPACACSRPSGVLLSVPGLIGPNCETLLYHTFVHYR